MAFADTTRSLDADFFGRIRAIRAKAADYFARRRMYRTTLTELQALSTRELADLGITSAQIHSIAYEAAWGEK